MGQGHQGRARLTKITCLGPAFVAGWGMYSAGYSGTPLWKKLGFKPAMKVCAINAPPHYHQLIGGPNDWLMVTPEKDADAIHLVHH